MKALDEQRTKLRDHKEHLYYLWSGSLTLFSVVLLAYVVIIVALFFSERYIPSVNAFEILQGDLLTALLFIYAIISVVSALVLWKEYRESDFKEFRLDYRTAAALHGQQPEFFNIKEFSRVIQNAVRKLRQREWKSFWRPDLLGPYTVEPAMAYKWRIYTYFEVLGYMGAGFFILALGYTSKLLPVIAFSSCVFALGFFILVSAMVRFDVSWYIHPIELEDQPELARTIEDGVVLVPRWTNVGTCNIYMRLKPRSTAIAQKPLQVRLEAAGINVEGDKKRDQPSKSVWDEVWNCAFPVTGDYALNLKINSKQVGPKNVTELSTITFQTVASGFLGRTLPPFLLAILPALITAAVTLMTKGVHT